MNDMSNKSIFKGKGIRFNYPLSWEAINGMDPVLVAVKDIENDIVIGISLQDYRTINMMDIDAVLKEEESFCRTFDYDIIFKEEKKADGRNSYEIQYENRSSNKNIIKIFIEREPGLYYEITRQSAIQNTDKNMNEFHAIIDSFKIE